MDRAPKEQIIVFMHEILRFFAAQNVKMAVVACNTMTALGIEMARCQYPFLLVGVNAGVDLALCVSKSKKVGIIATQATIASGKHARAVQEKDKEALAYPQACPKLVPLIEAEQVVGTEIESAVIEYLLPMKRAGVDAVILACTHYPFVLPVIQEVIGDHVAIIDPAKETALDAYRILQEQDKLSTAKSGKVKLCFSAQVEQAKQMAGYMIDTSDVDFELVNLER